MLIDRLFNGRKVIHTDKTITINGNGATVANLFTVTGIVKIESLYGIVKTATLAGDLTDCYFDIFPTGGVPVEMTKIAGSPAISGFLQGALIGKFSDAGQVLDVRDANVAIFLEAGVALQAIPYRFFVGKRNGAVTTIRFLYIAGADYSAETGQILWHCEWVAKSHDGTIVAA